MVWNFADYSGNDSSPSLPLLLSERSQQIILAALKSMDDDYAWIDYETEFDAIDAALGEIYSELLTVNMVDFTPVGTIVAYAGILSSIPEKWLLCDGAILNADDYTELRNVLDTPFDDNTNLYLPDLRSRFIYGASFNSDLGDVGGVEEVALTIAEMPAHSHETGVSAATGAGSRVARGTNTLAVLQPSTSVGGGEAHQNMPPFMKLFYIIKVLP